MQHTRLMALTPAIQPATKATKWVQLKLFQGIIHYVLPGSSSANVIASPIANLGTCDSPNAYQARNKKAGAT